MLRRPLVLLFSALAFASSAGASDEALRRRDLGGGFIQMLLTFRDPTPWFFIDRERYDPDGEDYVAVVNTMPMRARAEDIALTRPDDVPPIIAIRRPPQMVPVPPRVVRVPDLPPEFRRREVKYEGELQPGTIIVDTPRRLLFLVQENGRAIRYGIGVGRPGFEWVGVKVDRTLLASFAAVTPKIRSVGVRFIWALRFIASMERMSPRASALRYRRAASACVMKTLPTFTVA